MNQQSLGTPPHTLPLSLPSSLPFSLSDSSLILLDGRDLFILSWEALGWFPHPVHASLKASHPRQWPFKACPHSAPPMPSHCPEKEHWAAARLWPPRPYNAAHPPSLPATLAVCLFCKHAELVWISGPFHMLSPPLAASCPNLPSHRGPSATPLLTCHMFYCDLLSFTCLLVYIHPTHTH